uniref:Uncharacterized protein n=1 Tax=Solanum lycopersicum TaxID=4081 RepID=A0A3Q7GTS4_SOLLC
CGNKVKGGKRIWLSCWLQTVAWPINFISLVISYFYRRFCNYSYGYGVAKLPVSTVGLLYSRQLAFTAFVIVRLKFTSYSINSVFLLTIGAIILSLQSGSDRLGGETNKEYILGFIMIVASASSAGLIFPLEELIYKKVSIAVFRRNVVAVSVCLFRRGSSCSARLPPVRCPEKVRLVPFDLLSSMSMCCDDFVWCD